jgi:hypothetical protein
LRLPYFYNFTADEALFITIKMPTCGKALSPLYSAPNSIQRQLWS